MPALLIAKCKRQSKFMTDCAVKHRPVARGLTQSAFYRPQTQQGPPVAVLITAFHIELSRFACYRLASAWPSDSALAGDWRQG